MTRVYIILLGGSMNRLKDLREEKDLNQSYLAEFLGVSQVAYSQYETELYNISNDLLRKLSEFYNTSIDYIFYRTDNRKIYKKSVLKYYGNSNNLKALRLNHSKTQKMVATDLHIPLKTYIKYENTTIKINIQLMKFFADYYQTSMDYIMGLTNELSPHEKSIVEWDKVIN